MRTTRPFLYRVLVFIGAALQTLSSVANATEELLPLDSSSPHLALVAQWHRALVTGDYAAYKRVSVPPSDTFFFAQWRLYNELKKWTPPQVKVTGPKTLPNGNIDLSALGCLNGRRQVAGLLLVKDGNQFRVLSTGWADVWGPDLKKCPV